jgi:hypothetical protein
VVWCVIALPLALSVVTTSPPTMSSPLATEDEDDAVDVVPFPVADAGPPCSPRAERELVRARRLALLTTTTTMTAMTEGVVAAAAAARLIDERCVEAHAWLAWADLTRGDREAATTRWDDLWTVWGADDVSPRGLRAVALGAAVRGRVETLRLPREPRPPLPTIALEPASKTITLAAVGDVHLGRSWPVESAAVIPEEGRGYFDDVAATLTDASLTVGNLETALADSGDSYKCAPGRRRAGSCFTFRAPTVLAPRLAEAGFDVLSLANNHAADFGMSGLWTTERALEAARIAPVGTGGRSVVRDADGVRVAFLAFSAGELDPSVTDLQAVQGQVASLDTHADVVVVVFHAGAEGPAFARVPRAPESYLGEDRGDVVAFAHAAVDAGADVVLGSGPHVLRGVEHYRGRLIAYSLGNFSSWQTFPTTGAFAATGILVTEVAQNGVVVGARFVPTTLERTGRPAVDQSLRGLNVLRELSFADFGDALFSDEGQWRRGDAPRALPQKSVILSARVSTQGTKREDEARGPRDARLPRGLSEQGARVCTLAKATPLLRAGKAVTMPAGTRLVIGRQGRRFTDVALFDHGGSALLRNAYTGTCH